MVTILAIRGGREVLPDVRVEHLPALLAEPDVNIWVDLTGDMDDDALTVVRDVFRFHPLAIEDCFENREHPKIEAYDNYVYSITHGLTAGSTPEEPEVTELDAFIGAHFLVTYHQKVSRSVASMQELFRRGGEPARHGPAAILHGILERQAEFIEPVLDGIDDRIAELEERVMVRPGRQDLGLLLALRRSILQLRRWMSKQRDVVLRLARREFELVPAAVAVQFRDVYDHFVRFTDLLEQYRELTTSVQEAYLTMANNRLNETMKFLTMFTSVLMPLTVITGIYGMNFEHMPELRSRFGYPAVLVAMAVAVTLVIWYFRWRGWLGPEARAEKAEDARPLPPPMRTTAHRRATIER